MHNPERWLSSRAGWFERCVWCLFQELPCACLPLLLFLPFPPFSTHSGVFFYSQVGVGLGEGYNINIAWTGGLDPPMGDVEYLEAFRLVLLSLGNCQLENAKCDREMWILHKAMWRYSEENKAYGNLPIMLPSHSKGRKFVINWVCLETSAYYNRWSGLQ